MNNLNEAPDVFSYQSPEEIDKELDALRSKKFFKLFEDRSRKIYELYDTFISVIPGAHVSPKYDIAQKASHFMNNFIQIDVNNFSLPSVIGLARNTAEIQINIDKPIKMPEFLDMMEKYPILARFASEGKSHMHSSGDKYRYITYSSYDPDIDLWMEVNSDDEIKYFLLNIDPEAYLLYGYANAESNLELVENVITEAPDIFGLTTPDELKQEYKKKSLATEHERMNLIYDIYEQLDNQYDLSEISGTQNRLQTVAKSFESLDDFLTASDRRIPVSMFLEYTFKNPDTLDTMAEFIEKNPALKFFNKSIRRGSGFIQYEYHLNLNSFDNIEIILTEAKYSDAGSTQLPKPGVITFRGACAKYLIAALVFEDTELLEKKLQEDPEMYHYGDLDYARKAEQHRVIVGYNRSTGHFGTGFYLIGKYNPEKAYDYAKRGHWKVNTDSYNLFKPANSHVAYQLHDALKVLNSTDNFDWIQKIDKAEALWEDMYSAMEDLPEGNVDYPESCWDDINAVLDKYHVPDHVKDEMRWDFDQHRPGAIEHKFGEFIDDCNESYEDFNDAVKTLADIFDKTTSHIKFLMKKAMTSSESADSHSTIFMKSLGYDGVDVSGTDLDNFSYGSVIYDLKPGTYEKIKDKDLK